MSTTTRRAVQTVPSPYRIGEAMRALHEARERLLAIDPDMISEDTALYRDCLDGESGDAFAIIERVIRASLDAEWIAKATADRAKELAERKARADRRKETLRQVGFMMMEAAGLDRLDFPEFTASIRAGTPHVVVTDETALSDAYIRTTRSPDKTAIGAALKAGETVEGAVLSNPAPSLAVRTR